MILWKMLFQNDYQGVEICMTKAMEHDEDYGIGDNNEYLSVRFGLFAAEEITAADRLCDSRKRLDY